MNSGYTYNTDKSNCEMVTAKYAILLFHLIKERFYHIKDRCIYNLSISHNERQVYNVSIIYVSLIMRCLFLKSFKHSFMKR